jgi:hypothetical protein
MQMVILKIIINQQFVYYTYRQVPAADRIWHSFVQKTYVLR